MGPRVGFEIFKNRKISCPCRELNPDRPAPGQLTVPTAIFRLVNLETVFLNSGGICELSPLSLCCKH